MVSPTFYARSLTELVSLRAESQGDDAAVHTGVPEYEGLQTLSYKDVAAAVDRLAAYYCPLLVDNKSDQAVPPERTIAVLTATGIDEPLLEIALAKLGLTPLLLSVNNSPAAVAHLCKLTCATLLIYSPGYAATSAAAQRLLAAEEYTLDLLPEKKFPLWGPGGVRATTISPFPARLPPKVEAQRTAVILHSSGSTGFPKPVFVSHYGLIANAAVSVPKTGFSALPLFHGFGHFSIFRCLYHGKTFTLFPPHLPLTAANIVHTINTSPTRPVQHFAVPYVLKLLAESAAGTQSLADMEAVSFAGAALPDDLGTRLVSAGVPLFSQYGTTETGALLTSRRAYASDPAWNWLRIEGLIAEYLELVPRGSGTFEAVVKDGWPGKVMSNTPDGSYATKDLFVVHPEHDNWVKYVGRMDDTLTHTLGEKTNPVPIELAIRGNSPLVQECILFGDARPFPGALLLPSPAGAGPASNRAAYLAAVWPVIDAANADAPSHSRLVPEMIEILPSGTHVPVATKMSILRPACYVQFKAVIDGVYDRFEGASGVPKRVIDDIGEMEAFIAQTVQTAIGQTAHRDTDLFVLGVNSLQATRIRNVLQASLLLGTTLSQSVVYEYPSVARLAAFLVGGGRTSEIESESESVCHAMEAMVHKYAAAVGPAPALPTASNEDHPTGHTVLLTGATGSLGAHLLSTLAAHPNVRRIIALSRAPDHASSLARVLHSLSARQRALAPAKLVSFAADLGAPGLGLPPAEYAQCAAATIVLHNAWPVNFNLALSSFAPHIAAAVHLLNLARGAGAPFFFSSSVGTVQAARGVVSEAFPDAPHSAAGTGYARSKWVVERILEEHGGRVLRIGQLVGDTEVGIWNETEAWPLMFRSATVLGALPMLDERVGWMPVNRAASAIVEIVLAGGDQQVYHVLNDKEARWEEILDGLRCGGLAFETVPPAEWLDRLERSDPDVGANPAYKLLEFYKGRIGKEPKGVQFDVSKTARVSPTVASSSPVDAELVALWVGQWFKSGFFK